MRHWLRQILFFFILVVAFCLVYLNFFPRTPSLLGRPAPLFQATFPDKPPFFLNDYLDKKVILVNFWATWCEPCREEIPILNELSEKFKDRPFLVVGLMEDEVPKNLQAELLENFSQKVPIRFDVYTDNGGLVADQYGTFRIPETYLIDRDGTVIYKHSGPVTKWDRKALEEKIRELLF